MAISISFSSLLYALLFLYTDKNPIVPINFGYALGLCLIIAIGVFITFLIISSFGVWEAAFTSILWIITGTIITAYLYWIDKFEIISGLHETQDLVQTVLILSFFQMVLGLLFGYMIYPVAIKFKKNKSNYIEI